MSGRLSSPEVKWKVVAALDFGTTYSGFAYCIPSDGNKEPEIITNPPWPSGSGDLQFLKAPTTVLLDEDGKFDSFGFEAERKYAKLVLRKKHKKWYYLSRFKMMLYRDYGSMAGIPGEQLSLALEPEAASLYVLSLKKSRDGIKKQLIDEGVKYINIDLGGGTADVTVHKTLANGAIEEIYRPSGGYWGGTQVDMSFDKLLVSFCGQDTITSWAAEHQADYFDLRRDFEAIKRSFNPQKDDEECIRIPASLTEMVKRKTGRTLNSIISQAGKGGTIIFEDGRLIFQAEVFRSLFKTSVEGIVNHLEDLLKKLDESVSTIVLVGGFSQSPTIKSAIQTNFKRMTIIIPDQPGLAVMRGATLFGQNKKIVARRVSPYSYGFNLFKQYQHGDPENQVSWHDGKPLTGDVFDVHVRAGESIEIGKAGLKRTYTSVNQNQHVMILFVYRSAEPNPRFCTDPGCTMIGDITIDLPTDNTASVVVELRYWDTEIVVKAFEENTKKSVTVTLDTLKKE